MRGSLTWVSGNTGSIPVIRCTTNRLLPETIKELSAKEDFFHLILMASQHIEMISFRVRSPQVKALTILRCQTGSQDDSGPRMLLIDGASTFSRIRADRWQEEKRKKRFILGEHVRIKVDKDWIYSTPNLSSDRIGRTNQRVERYLDRMENANKGGDWWNDWKSAIAGIMGLLTGGSKFWMGIDAAAKGMMVQFHWGNFGFQAAAGSANFTSAVAAAGPVALGVGVGVAAAVYFIPWPEVFAWLDQNIFSRFWRWIAALCQRFQTWASQQMQFFDQVSGTFNFS